MEYFVVQSFLTAPTAWVFSKQLAPKCLGQFSARGVKPAHNCQCHLPKLFESPPAGCPGGELNTQGCRAVLMLFGYNLK